MVKARSSATKRKEGRRLVPRQVVSIRTILPNLVTLSAFVMGLAAIKFAIDGRFEMALTALAFAGVLDGLDGTVARLLHSTSRFGAELDSLSDVVAFGVAPAVMIYLWGLEELGRLGWGAAMIFAIALALRLARFNAQLEEGTDPRARLGFFTGIPAPVGAALFCLPMAMDFSFTDGALREYGPFLALNSLFVAFLMVSTIATPSLKQVRVNKKYFAPLLLLLGALVVGLLARPWHVLSVFSLCYLLSLPFIYAVYRRRLEQKGWQE